MEEKIRQLEEENSRLREALRAVAHHQQEIQALLDGVKDLLAVPESSGEKAHVTDDDVKNLLKKYSRL